jgi:effector-binding domain-containing protein
MGISKRKTHHKQTFRYILTNADTETEAYKQIKDTKKKWIKEKHCALAEPVYERPLGVKMSEQFPKNRLSYFQDAGCGPDDPVIGV